MTNTIKSLSEQSKIILNEPSKLGQIILKNIPEEKGIYLIFRIVDKNLDLDGKPQINMSRIEDWIQTAPEMTLDGNRPTVHSLATFLESFWHENENILYIGKAGGNRGLRERIGALLRHGGLSAKKEHKLGKGSPHAGGHWLYSLAKLDKLWLCHTADIGTIDVSALETRLMELFILGRGGIGPVDLPWANLEIRSIGSDHPAIIYRRKQKRLKKSRG